MTRKIAKLDLESVHYRELGVPKARKVAVMLLAEFFQKQCRWGHSSFLSSLVLVASSVRCLLPPWQALAVAPI